MLFRLVLGLSADPLGSRSDPARKQSSPRSRLHQTFPGCMLCRAGGRQHLVKTLPVNAQGTCFGSEPMQAKYVCSEPSTSGARQWLHRQSPGWTEHPTMGGLDEIVDGVARANLVATDFAKPWEPTTDDAGAADHQQRLLSRVCAPPTPTMVLLMTILGMVHNTPGCKARRSQRSARM